MDRPRKRSGRNPAGELTDDLVVEILSRLCQIPLVEIGPNSRCGDLNL
jgi:hypothetical protein